MTKIFRTMTVACAAGALFAAGIMAVSPAHADMKVVKDRQAAMKSMSDANKAIKAYVDKGEGTPAAVSAAAMKIASTAEKIPTLFPKGTSETDAAAGKNRAKPDIWMKWSAFEKNAEKLKTSAVALADAGKSGDKGKIKAAFAAMGKNCGGCHKPFRGAKK